MAIADILAEELGTVNSLTTVVKAIRPVNVSPNDDRPYVCYETVEMRSILGLNGCVPGIYEGSIRFYIASNTHTECNELAEIVKESLDGLRGVSDATYTLTLCRMDGEEDIAQNIDEREKPFYVKAIDFAVRGKKQSS